MKSRWLACLLLTLVSLGLACKGDDGGGGVEFLDIVTTAPEDDDLSVPVEVVIGFRASEPIAPSTLTSNTFFLTDEGGTVVPSTVRIFNPQDVAPSEVDTAAALTPDAPLSVITNYTVTVTTGLVSTRGKSLEEDFEWTFRTIDAEWGESEWIEPEGLGNSTGSVVRVADDLSAIAVWALGDDRGTAIFANRYTRIDLWGDAEPIDDGNGGAANPKLAVDAQGNGFAVWERTDQDTSEGNIWTNRYDVEDGLWGAPMLLQDGEVTRARAPAIAADPDGNAIAIWAQQDLETGREVVRASRYEPGAGWGSATTIASPTTTSAGGRTALGMDDRGAAIAVWDPSTGQGRVLWANRYAPGEGWGEPVVVKSDVATGANDFRLDVGANGDAFLVWEQDDGSEMPRDDIWASHFSAGEWSDPERIDRHDNGDKGQPDVALDGAGNGYAVWSQVDADFTNIWAARYAPGEGWGTPELVEPPNEDPTEDGDAETPRVDSNRVGNVFVVWRQVWGQWPSIWSNRLDPGTAWMTAERVEDAASAANLPVIAVDEARHAHAVWQHSVSGGRSIRTSRFE